MIKMADVLPFGKGKKKMAQLLFDPCKSSEDLILKGLGVVLSWISFCQFSNQLGGQLEAVKIHAPFIKKHYSEIVVRFIY